MFVTLVLVNVFTIASSASSVKIEKLLIPEVVQAGKFSSALLDCLYSGVSDQFTLQWLFNDSESPIYQWSPSTNPQINGRLEGRLNLSHLLAPSNEKRALRITSLDPELSGDYTCRILDRGTEVRQTKTMLVYSPEKDFTLEFIRQHNEVKIKCTARGLYPQPELTLERNGVMFPKQQQRMWRSEGLLFDAESTSFLAMTTPSHAKPEQITCRLQLPQAGYTAIKKELLYIGKECSNNSSTTYPSCIGLFLIVAISMLH